METEILSLDLQYDLAMVRLLVTDSALPQPFRETQFCRETPGGWLRTQPEPAFWGRQECLESEHFVFHCRVLDRAAMAEASMILDERYARNRALLGLPQSRATTPEAKIQVFVYAKDDLDVGRPVQVDSPWQRTLPSSVTDAGFLVEAVDLDLGQRLVFESRAAAPHQSNSRLPAAGWLDGLRLWLVWQNGGLLADHKTELVHWPAMATLLEYATQTYGPGTVPRLLDAAVAGESWQTVAPELFGVTLEEFQTGWEGYLAEASGIEVPGTSSARPVR